MSIRRLLFFFLTTELEWEPRPAGAQLYIMQMISLLTLTSGCESLPQNRSLDANSAPRFAIHFAFCCSCDKRRAAPGRRPGGAAAPRIPHRAHRTARRGRGADGARHPALPEGAQ